MRLRRKQDQDDVAQVEKIEFLSSGDPTETEPGLRCWVGFVSAELEGVRMVAETGFSGILRTSISFHVNSI
jgi:hypothetical protein